MTLAVVDSVAFDSVPTPFGEREHMLGGSATHFSLAASFFTKVRVVGVVGEDFGDDQIGALGARGIDTEGPWLPPSVSPVLRLAWPGCGQGSTTRSRSR
jgi:hypothetical protein